MRKCWKTAGGRERSRDRRRLIGCMKKLLLLSAVLLGAATVSHAGVRVGIGIGLPVPTFGVVVRQPAPVYVAPRPVYYVAPTPVYVAPPVYCAAPAPVYVAPPAVVVAPAPVYYWPYACSPGYRCAPAYRYGRGWHR